jgi:hypothetical protein
MMKTVVKVVNGDIEITGEVTNGFVTDEVTWYYRPEDHGHAERIDASSAMNNTLGYLIVGLLKAAGAVTDEQKNELEQMLG